MKIKSGLIVFLTAFAMIQTYAEIVVYDEDFDTTSSTDGWYLFTGTTTGQAISRLNGAGPRYDWADNDDGVAQSALSTGDPLPAGGTITGDGNLADGGLQWNVGNGTKGDERIAYNLAGTIETGETLTLTYNLYNHVDYYNEVTGYFYDLTDGVQLNADSWVITKAITDPIYAPADKVVTYTGTAATAGHQIAIVFREWHSSTARVAYFDHIMVTSAMPGSIAGITNTFSSASDIQGWFNMGSVNASIKHLPAGARKDYWDGDDSVAQPTRTSSESNAVVAAGGTITGDGLLADGALWFDVQDGSSGNESIAFMLEGEMVEGEVIQLSYNAFNNVSYYNMVQGQLWDMTTSNQLTMANWVTVQAYSAADYRPYNSTVSYLTTAAEAGHKLAIVFREWGNSSTRDPYIDNIRVTATLVDPERRYKRWAADSGLTSGNNAYTNDPDGDALDNLYEYAIDGNPIDAADRGTWPVCGVWQESGTNWFGYVQPRRSDFWLGGLNYNLETSSNLVDGVGWAEGDFGIVGIDESGESLDYVTNRLLSLETPAQFVRMTVDDPALRPVASEEIGSLEQKTTLFGNGSSGIHTYRIPVLVTATNGDLIACCDGRHYSSSDLGNSMDIDIVFRRSTDNGATWSAMAKICDFGYGYPASDSSLVLDQTTGEIFCFYNYMDQNSAPGEYRFRLQRSTDCGVSWGSHVDITDQLADPGWADDVLKFIVSGRGSQTRDGWLLHTMFVGTYNGLYLFGSDDHGTTWQRMGVPINPANESKVVELNDGSLMINSRVDYSAGLRWVHVSEDQGQTWSSLADPNLADPGNNASIIRYTSKKDGYAKDRLLFCNTSDASVRQNLAVRISYDEGKSWSEGKVIDAGLAAYSSMTICADGSIGVLYYIPNVGVTFARLTLEELTDGKDSLSVPYQL